MVGEAFAGLSAIKTAFDIAKGLKDIDDVARRNAAVIELQEKILAAHQAQSALAEQVHDLETEVAALKAWDADKQRYELKTVGRGAVAYMLKPGMRDSEPPHWLCQNCYANHKKAFFQPTGNERGRLRVFKCISCDGVLATEYEQEWIE
jgi:hypothetical protein